MGLPAVRPGSRAIRVTTPKPVTRAISAARGRCTTRGDSSRSRCARETRWFVLLPQGHEPGSLRRTSIMRRRAPTIVRLFQSAGTAWWEDDAMRLGASLAYYTLFAIAPILLVATAIAGMVFGA